MTAFKFMHYQCIFLDFSGCLITGYVGQLMATVLELCMLFPSYKAATAHYSQAGPVFLSSTYEPGDKQALVKRHCSRYSK